MNQNSDLPLVRREILTYLGNFPEKLRNQGISKAPDLILALGNCLCWISSTLDENNQPVNPTLCPQSVIELGRQFQEIGRTLDAENTEPNFSASIRKLKSQWDTLEKRINRLEGRRAA